MTTWTRIHRITVKVTLLYAFIFVCMLILRPGTRHFYDAFFNIYQIFPPLFSGIIGIIYYRYGRHSHSIRRTGWLLIALACLSFAEGQCAWTYLESIRGIEVPFPSWADAGYLGTYVFLIIGVFLLFGSMPVVGRLRQSIDGAIIACSLGILSWDFLIQRIWHQSDVPLTGKLISIAYPLGDIIALFGALILIANARRHSPLRSSLNFLAAGILGFTFFDTSFTWMSLNGTYQTGSWSDWTISFGWILIGYAFLTRMWWTGNEKTYVDLRIKKIGARIHDKYYIFLPYVAVLISCSIVAIHDYTQVGMVKDSSVAAGMFLMAIVMIRQILALLENRHLNIELKTFNDNLEELVAQRTKELENQNKMILAMAEERNRFYRHVSHEVRTPLTSVVGFSEVMMEDDDEPLTAWQKTQLQKVIDGAHRLLSMIDDLLDISKVEAKKMDIHYNAVKLDDLIRQVADSLMPVASGKALNLVVNLAENPPVVTTDEYKLTQILVNLLSNAIKYTPEGTVSISADWNSESVSISVKDTGVGIPEDEICNVFKEFYRVHNGLTQRGSGLGLAIVQKLANLLGGQITVQSKQGAGSTFTLTLPIVLNNDCPSASIVEIPAQTDTLSAISKN